MVSADERGHRHRKGAGDLHVLLAVVKEIRSETLCLPHASHHGQDQVNVLPPGPRRQQPQLLHAPHRRETITGLQLGVDVPDVRVDITGIR